MKFNEMRLFEWKSTDFELHCEDAPIPDFMNWGKLFYQHFEALPKAKV